MVAREGINREGVQSMLSPGTAPEKQLQPARAVELKRPLFYRQRRDHEIE